MISLLSHRSGRSPLFTVLGIAALLLVSIAFPDDANLPSVTSHSIFAEQEDLVYEVSWTFFKLGTIRINTLGDYKAMAHIDSYESIPFVDLHSIHYAEMDSTFHSSGGYAIDKNGKEWTGFNYVPAPSTGDVTVEQLFHKDPSLPPYRREVRDTIRMDSPLFVDGLSIAFLPRLLLQSSQTVSVPTILMGNTGTTTFYFLNNKTTESIDALDEPVKVVKVEGTTTAVGVYGMSGDFAGWFSDDEAAVPIKGQLKVLLGNVTLELVQWNRKGWKPPQ